MTMEAIPGRSALQVVNSWRPHPEEEQPPESLDEMQGHFISYIEKAILEKLESNKTRTWKWDKMREKHS